MQLASDLPEPVLQPIRLPEDWKIIRRRGSLHL